VGHSYLRYAPHCIRTRPNCIPHPFGNCVTQNDELIQTTPPGFSTASPPHPGLNGNRREHVVHPLLEYTPGPGPALHPPPWLWWRRIEKDTICRFHFMHGVIWHSNSGGAQHRTSLTNTGLQSFFSMVRRTTLDLP